jgi:hypothetical protein
MLEVSAHQWTSILKQRENGSLLTSRHQSSKIFLEPARNQALDFVLTRIAEADLLHLPFLAPLRRGYFLRGWHREQRQRGINPYRARRTYVQFPTWNRERLSAFYECRCVFVGGADAVVIADEHGGLTFVPMLKRCQSGRGSLFCKIRRVTCRTYRSAGPPGSSAVPQTPPSSREAARGGVRELVEKHGSGR